MASAWIGTSGYVYRHWAGRFYPKGLPQREWFDHYARTFSTVELNVTFYRLPQAAVFRSWARRAPQEFRYVLKGSRLITHYRRLSDVDEAVAALLDRAGELGDRLACLLWQLPFRFEADARRLEGFLRLLGRSKTGRKTRHAFEFRDESWFADDVHGALRRANAAIVLADMPFQVLPPGMRARASKRPPVRVPHTADWIYLRRHGPGTRYGSAYPPAMIRTDARWISRWLTEGKEVFAFYNNDIGGHAVRNAKQLERLVSGRGGRKAVPRAQELGRKDPSMARKESRIRRSP